VKIVIFSQQKLTSKLSKLEAGVVCRELGYSGASAYYASSHFGNVPADFSYDNVEESIQ
jgi:hypothetical protein